MHVAKSRHLCAGQLAERSGAAGGGVRLQRVLCAGAGREQYLVDAPGDGKPARKHVEVRALRKRPCPFGQRRAVCGGRQPPCRHGRGGVWCRPGIWPGTAGEPMCSLNRGACAARPSGATRRCRRLTDPEAADAQASVCIGRSWLVASASS